MENQLFAAVNATDNSVVKYGAAGIFGLGFPTQRCDIPVVLYLLALTNSEVLSKRPMSAIRYAVEYETITYADWVR